jgi:hypothetical protein
VRCECALPNHRGAAARSIGCGLPDDADLAWGGLDHVLLYSAVMTVALIACFVGLLVLLALRTARPKSRVERLSQNAGNSLDRALYVLIRDVSNPPSRHDR